MNQSYTSANMATSAWPGTATALDLLQEALRNVKPLGSHKVRTHPSNRQYLIDTLRQTYENTHNSRMALWMDCLQDPLFGIPVYFIESMPPRNIEKRWHPPKPSRFVEYGPEDEYWLRPFGIGTIEEIDHGPLIEIYDDSRTMRFFLEPLPFFPEPRGFLFNTTC